MFTHSFIHSFIFTYLFQWYFSKSEAHKKSPEQSISCVRKVLPSSRHTAGTFQMPYLVSKHCLQAGLTSTPVRELAAPHFPSLPHLRAIQSLATFRWYHIALKAVTEGHQGLIFLYLLLIIIFLCGSALPWEPSILLMGLCGLDTSVHVYTDPLAS